MRLVKLNRKLNYSRIVRNECYKCLKSGKIGLPLRGLAYIILNCSAKWLCARFYMKVMKEEGTVN